MNKYFILIILIYKTYLIYSLILITFTKTINITINNLLIIILLKTYYN